ncbi:hypothetical protein THERMOT_1273 [Bathymodiolus thermophilus thioautotrophic gill symbiont]|uniref:Uncharacterized protein n=3 Tax=Bathymodiolus thermophilus thioautotrophic gill symbiont TaxID=2360 RepID=A0A1J5TTG9_9GAMM|nr:hypothetical protein [Bathymodiolus thermophilus thioautotrophic gill symbiont]OIR24152.1 hypothetical protein BGC33_14450 [Bathymodiolus thermophilus thioautotrophic gill symbiont]CAB5498090.1 hypothetical protein THERMOS_782 [Bathymodiolus thermophilus thioautotrophic gill symbiont]CAB5500618.1 hypothetical protein THERMOT_1273 [Bathymodiolus thermophilus thioautotrophic gill symbiont]
MLLMKFKNIFFGFLKTLLLAVIFYSSLLYASIFMFLDLQNYPYTANDFRPYFFTMDATTGNLIKVPDTQNIFQFKTYNLDLKSDVALYKAEVKPVLLKWKATITEPDTDSELASDLSGQMERYVRRDLTNRLPSREVRVVIYEDNIEAVSYMNNAKQTPEIDIIAANPEGMLEGQTTIVKGGGSALLEHIVRAYQEEGVERVRLYAVHSGYYAKRGWKVEGACGY